MLNAFPELLTFSFFAPLLLRVAVGSFFLIEGRRHLSDGRTKAVEHLGKRLGTFAPFFVRSLGTIEGVVGVMLIVGFFTQVAALLGAVAVLKMLLFEKTYKGVCNHSRMTYVIILAACLSLVLSGAGALAVDLPF